MEREFAVRVIFQQQTISATGKDSEMGPPRKWLHAIAIIGVLAVPVNAIAGDQPEPKHSGTPTHATELTTPEFLVQAEKHYRDAEAALSAEKQALDQLLQDEEKLRHQAIAKTGSWIEPTPLWHKKLALEQSIKSKKDAERRALAQLKSARVQAHAISESKSSKTHKPSWFLLWRRW